MAIDRVAGGVMRYRHFMRPTSSRQPSYDTRRLATGKPWASHVHNSFAHTALNHATPCLGLGV